MCIRDRACLCLGGELQKRLAGADLTFEMPVMGDFSVLFQFWDADEEFPAKILLLWDKAVSYTHLDVYKRQARLISNTVLTS